MCCSTPPKERAPPGGPPPGDRPRATSLRVSISRWKRISSSSWLSTALRRRRVRNAVSTRDGHGCPPHHRPASTGRENAGHRLRETLPALLLRPRAACGRARQLVEAGAAVVLRGAPLRADPPLRLQAVERGIERALVDLEDVLAKAAGSAGRSPSRASAPRPASSGPGHRGFPEGRSVLGRHRRLLWFPSAGESPLFLSNVKRTLQPARGRFSRSLIALARYRADGSCRRRTARAARTASLSGATDGPSLRRN